MALQLQQGQRSCLSSSADGSGVSANRLGAWLVGAPPSQSCIAVSHQHQKSGAGCRGGGSEGTVRSDTSKQL